MITATSHNPVLNDTHFLKCLQDLKIRVVAPASGCDHRLFKTLSELNQLIPIHIPPGLLSKSTPFHANSDNARLSDLIDALEDPNHNILWTLRGGYGSSRLIEGLSKIKKPKKEKIFIGFSDITALHLFLSQQWNWNTIHAYGITGLLNPELDPDNFIRLADILTQRVSHTQIDHLHPLNDLAKKTPITGELTGGNSTLIQTSIGTTWQLEAKERIVFLEDVNEKAYKVDRVLNHFRQTHLLHKAKAIVFGDFYDKDTDTNVALERFANETSIPMYKTNQFGHGKLNHPLIYRSRAQILPNGELFSLRMDVG